MALGSNDGSIGKTASVQELIKVVKKLYIAQSETADKVKKIRDTDREIKESQRRLAKLPMPAKFKGVPADLDGWVLQVKTYLTYNDVKFEDVEGKTYFAIVLLDRVAIRQFEPFLKRYYKQKDLDEGSKEEKALLGRHPDLKEIFDNIDSFFTNLYKEFGKVDAERKAEQRLIIL